LPLNRYFGGHGREVMRDMRERHGERAEEVFYRTANKQKQAPRRKTRMKLRHR
jgi:hypothetical protein